MTAIPLVVRDLPNPANFAYACGKCSRIYDHSNRDLADSCCQPRKCACGALAKEYHMVCSDCDAKATATKKAADFERATKQRYSSEMGPWLCWEDAGEEGFFCNVEDLYDYCFRKGLEVPEWVWGTTSRTLRLDAVSILESALDEHHEDAIDRVEDISLLQTLLDLWCDRQIIETFDEDRSLAILIPPDPDNRQECVQTDTYKCRGCSHEYEVDRIRLHGESWENNYDPKNWVLCAQSKCWLPKCPKCGRTQAKRTP